MRAPGKWNYNRTASWISNYAPRRWNLRRLCFWRYRAPLWRPFRLAPETYVMNIQENSETFRTLKSNSCWDMYGCFLHYMKLRCRRLYVATPHALSNLHIYKVWREKNENYFLNHLFFRYKNSIPMIVPFKIISGRVYAALHSRFPWNRTITEVFGGYRLQLLSRVLWISATFSNRFPLKRVLILGNKKSHSNLANKAHTSTRVLRHCNRV